MQWASAVSRQPDLDDALEDAAGILDGQLAGKSADLICVFGARYEDLQRAAPWFQARYSPTALIGCTASGVVGGGQEVENRPGLSVTAASLPGAVLTPFAWEADSLPDLDRGPGAWHEWTGIQPGPAAFLLLANPTEVDPTDLLMGLDFAYPTSVKVGGLASGYPKNRLLLGGEAVGAGVVGVAISGGVRVDTVVAQGCRPIGKPLTVTKCMRNVLIAVEDEDGPLRPTEALGRAHAELSPEAQARFSETLQLGIAQSGLLGGSDYLIRNVLGADPEKGIVITGALLRPGQTLQFHLRDGEAAHADLNAQLDRFSADTAQPAGALLFTCSGRGEGLFGVANHDADAFRERVGDVPLGGFFCAGEIGPVGAETHLHGYTSAFALFAPE